MKSIAHVTNGDRSFRDLLPLEREMARHDQRAIHRSTSHPSPKPTKHRLGLALSCGAAKGLAHIGVIQVLEEHGICPDIIAGSSMGAYIAAVWGMGHDGREMERLACEIDSRWKLLRLMDPVFPPRRGFMKGGAIIRRLRRTIGDAQVEDLKRPIRVIATDLNTLERKVFTTGELASAVHASCAIPGICVPVKIDGRTYIDGGISEPLPVDVLIENGVERIIAVNTVPTPSILKCAAELEKERSESYSRGGVLAKHLNHYLNYFDRGNLLDIMMRAVQGSQMRVAETACGRADIVLRPIAVNGQWHEFDRPEKFIEVGRWAAEAQLPRIKALLTEDTYEKSVPQEELVVAV